MKNVNRLENFINKSIDLWGYKYDYSRVEYIDYRTPVIIGYKGLWYKQTPDKHLNGKKIELQESRMSTENFIVLSKNKWGDNRYDYSECEYLGTNNKIRLFDKINNRWIEQVAKSHLKGYEVAKLTKDEFIQNCNIFHNYKYQYNLENYKSLTSSIIIKCGLHGDFKLKASSHLYGSGCVKCIDTKIKKIIRKYLNYFNINFKEFHKFDGCKNIIPLKFDFYIPTINTCIELLEIHHFEPIESSGGVESFEKVKTNDKIKEQYCEDNYINLIRIKYDKIDNIEEILKENLKVLLELKNTNL